MNCFYHQNTTTTFAGNLTSNFGAGNARKYLLFGELRVDQRVTGWNTQYSFCAKEKDEESGYLYLGARYYIPDISIFPTCDPMSDKYPSLTPYNYCANNPLRLIDPNGMEISEHTDKFGKIIAHYDDGDNSVYMHKTETTKAQIDLQRVTSSYPSGGGQRIGELGGQIDMSVIFENKLTQSSNEAKGMNMSDYGNAVLGKWDLKNNTNTIWGVAWAHDQKNKTNTTFSFGSYTDMNAADVGNYHAGYTGEHTKIPAYVLFKGAGAAETLKEWQKGSKFIAIGRAGFLLNPASLQSGDRRKDFLWNATGMQDARNRKK